MYNASNQFSLADFSLGWDLVSSPTALDPRSLRECMNMILVPNKGIAKRNGAEKYVADPVVGEDKKVVDLYEYADSVGTVRILATADKYLTYWNGSAWTTLKDDRTVNLRSQFLTYQGSCYTVNGYDDNLRIHGTSVYPLGIAPPVLQPTVAEGAAGILNGTHTWAYCYKRAVPALIGNPTKSDEMGGIVNKKIDVHVYASPDPQVTAIVLYRTYDYTISGDNTTFYKVTELSNTDQTYSDNIPDADLGEIMEEDNWNPPKSKLMCLYKDQVFYANCPEGDEILEDGSFEYWNSTTDLITWIEEKLGTSTVNKETTSKIDGLCSVRIDVDASNSLASVSQTFSLVKGKRYRLSLWYYNSVAGKTSCLAFYDTPGNNVHLQLDGTWGGSDITLPNAAGWTRVVIDFETNPSYTNYIITLKRLSSASSSIYFDKVSLRELNEDDKSVVVYSKQGKGEAVPTNNYEYFDRGDGNEITGLAALPDFLIVFKKNKTFAIQGDFASKRGIAPIYGRGCIAPWAILQFEDKILYLSEEGWMAFDGITFYPISERINILIQEGYVRLAEAANYSAAYLPEREQIHFLCNHSTLTKRVFVGHFLLPLMAVDKGLPVSEQKSESIVGWTYHQYPSAMLLSCLANYTDSSGNTRLLAGSTNGYVYKLDSGSHDDGEDIEFAVETGWHTLKKAPDGSPIALTHTARILFLTYQTDMETEIHSYVDVDFADSICVNTLVGSDTAYCGSAYCGYTYGGLEGALMQRFPLKGTGIWYRLRFDGQNHSAFLLQAATIMSRIEGVR